MAKRRADSRRGASNRSGGKEGAEDAGEEGGREMTDDLSKDLTDGERLNLILADLAKHNSMEA